MQRGQLLIQSVIVKMINPLNWGYLPGTAAATLRSVDTNLPLWEMPRLGLALVRAVLTNTLNAQTVTPRDGDAHHHRSGRQRPAPQLERHQPPAARDVRGVKLSTH